MLRVFSIVIMSFLLCGYQIPPDNSYIEIPLSDFNKLSAYEKLKAKAYAKAHNIRWKIVNHK